MAEEVLYVKISRESGERQLKAELKRIQESKKLILKDKKLLMDYCNFYNSSGKHGKTIAANLSTLRHMVERGIVKKPLSSFTEDDKAYIDVFSAINSSKEWKTQRSKERVRCTLMTFHRQRFNTPNRPKSIQRVKITMKKKREPNLDMIITKPRLLQLVRATDNMQESAMLSLLFISGARVSEFCSLRIRDLNLDPGITEKGPDGKDQVLPNFIKLFIPQTKTKPRNITASDADVALLRKWMVNHPEKDKPNAPLFGVYIKNCGEFRPLSPAKVSWIIHKAAIKSGLAKVIGHYDESKKHPILESSEIYLNPHAFRKSRACDLADQGYTESQLKEYFGWDSAESAETYRKIGEKGLENCAKKSAGYAINGTGVQKLSVCCPICAYANSADVDKCENCGSPLSDKQSQAFMKGLMGKIELLERLLVEKGVIEAHSVNSGLYGPHEI